MGVMSDYLEAGVVNHLFRTSTFSKPSVLAICLCTSSPVDTDTGATIPEVANTGSYARVEVNPSNANWSDPTTTGQTSNVSDITFTTATGPWTAPITHIAICDSSTYGAGNLLWYGQLATSKTVTSGDVFKITAGNLVVTVDA